MSIIKNIFQNFRKPKNSFMGRCIVKMMNQGHNRISLWCIDNFVKLSGGETVLDIVCGGGQNVANFIKRTHGLVCGMDYSPTCVDIASRKNKAAISQGRASIVEANVSNIPFDDNRFDIVTAFETIYFWNDIVENFKEVLRVLKPEGRFYICNEACSEEGNEKWVRNIDLRIYSPIEIQRMLEQAGFINVTYDISPESQSQRICVQATKQPMMKPIHRLVKRDSRYVSLINPVSTCTLGHCTTIESIAFTVGDDMETLLTYLKGEMEREDIQFKY